MIDRKAHFSIELVQIFTQYLDLQKNIELRAHFLLPLKLE